MIIHCSGCGVRSPNQESPSPFCPVCCHRPELEKLFQQWIGRKPSREVFENSTKKIIAQAVGELDEGELQKFVANVRAMLNDAEEQIS